MRLISRLRKTVSDVNRVQMWLLFAFIGLAFLTATIYVSFPDEFINLIAGQFINRGQWPYIDYFDHHLPMAWYVGAILLRLSFGSYVLFRILYVGMIFLSLLVLGLHIRKTNPQIFPYFLIFFFFYPFVSLFLWLQIYVADSLAVFFFSISFWLLLSETFKEKHSNTPIYISTIFSFFLVLSSLTFIYISVCLYLWGLYLVNRDGFSVRRSLSFIYLSVAPYIYYIVHVIVTGQWHDFYIANFYYNTNLYISIPNYERGGSFNPIKFALTLVNNFYVNYLPLLTRIRELDLYAPIVMVAALGSFLFLLILLIENKLLFLVYFVMLSFSSPRADVSKITDAGYQGGLYIFFGLMSALMVLFRSQRLIFDRRSPQEIFRVASTFLLTLFFVYMSIFMMFNLFQIGYNIYTQKMPRIYDTSHPAIFIDEIINEGDYYWMGPYEPHHIFFVNKGRLPGRFPSLLPQFREDPLFADAFIQQFEENPPKIIILKNEASIFNTPIGEFGKFFITWMNGKYVRVADFKEYKELRSPSEFTLRDDLWIRKEDSKEIFGKLLDKGYIGEKKSE